MTAEYDLTPEDIAAFAQYHQSQPGAAGDFRLMRYGLAAVFLLFFLVRLAIGVTPGDFVWPVFAVLWFLLLPRFHRAGVRHDASRVAEQGLARGAVGPHRMTVGPRGITDTTPHYECATYWSGIDRVVKLPERVIVYVGPNAALQVPRRAFASDAAFDDFVRALQEGTASPAA